jgi:sirohydrochlorin cobaltochelatase
MTEKTHNILLAHGSRDQRWCDTLEAGLDSVSELLHHQASLAYMEMAEPSLEQLIQREYAAGSRVFEIFPLFFSAGKHLLIDVPEQVDKLRLELAGVTINLNTPLGNEPGFWHFIGSMLNKKLPAV